jgi:hypothetical protein
MKQQTFQIAILLLAGTAILTCVCLSLIYIFKFNKCPVANANANANVNANTHTSHCLQTNKCPNANVDRRDRAVLNDPLYPAQNRTDSQNYIEMNKQIDRGNMYQNPDDANDTFRLIGYLSSTDQEHRDTGSNNWKFFGRMKDKVQGEYYISPANKDIDMKIPLTSNIVVGERLRDVFSLPSHMQFNTPMLNDSPYVFTELPKGDIGSGRYF